MTRAHRDEHGFVGGLEAIAFGMLVFVSGTLIASSAWGVVDTKFAVAAAAREAARSYVEATDAEQADANARQAAAGAIAGYGRPAQGATVLVVSGAFGRCVRITVEVRYPAPVVSVPFVGRLGRGSVVRARHSELVDPFRSGLPGRASCA